MIKLNGVAASPGIVIGKAYLLDITKLKITKEKIPAEAIDRQINSFREAVSRTEKEIMKVKEKVHTEMGEEYANIFEAHLLVLKDPLLIFEVSERIKKEQINVEYALWEVLEMITENIADLDNEYMRERVVDIYDIGRRILENLLGGTGVNFQELEEDVIVIAHNLTPSDTAHMYKGKIIGFATDIGGQTSHTAIMARALEIPAVVGLRDITFRVKADDTLIIDGGHGIVIIEPDEQTIQEYEQKRKLFDEFKVGLTWLRDLPGQTNDGYRIEIAANIELPQEVDVVKQEKAEGIGLYRTEFLYLGRTELPDEDEQLEAYRQVVSQMNPCPVTIRTLDVGGDKFLSYLGVPIEVNPSLGLRAIRLCLKHQEMFKTQLKALFRASTFGKLRIMFPMISELDEIIQVKKIIEEVKQELKIEKVCFDPNIEIGVMIETPSAALTADVLSGCVDFFSIGTNDLIQYTIAIDRVNEQLTHLYNPLHPAILRLINWTIESAHRQGIWVGMCGEMAGDPLFTMLLVGMGIDELSMSCVAIPKVKEVIRSIGLLEAKELAQKILKLQSAAEIETTLNEVMYNRFAQILNRK
ncbi:MAG: phosphoenolpyruvate--protein phosphotransferase [bacterium]|nr:phosphoenolpyruvate--protein phosphotransferase [bacterium]